MTTSGLTTFAPTFDEILQDAAGMVGGGPILAEELAAARRGMDLLLTEIQNRGPLLHKIETVTVSVAPATSSVALPAAYLDVHHVQIADAAGDNAMQANRLSFESWAGLTNKDQVGRPTQYWFDRRQNGNILWLWPVPLDSHQIRLTVQQVPENTFRAFQNVDEPRRFIPAVTYGLAYWIGLRRNKTPADRITMLKQLYEGAIRDAMREDRERVSFQVRM